jgi:uncharacterized repeat protein (TIGR02543 family)
MQGIETTDNLGAGDVVNVTLSAQWNEGTTRLPSPTKTGYEFGGWYEDAEFTTLAGGKNAVYTPTQNVTLHAKWTANTVTVSYNGNQNNGTIPGSTGSGGWFHSTETFKYDTDYTVQKNPYTKKFTQLPSFFNLSRFSAKRSTNIFLFSFLNHIFLRFNL